MNNSKRRKKRN